MRKSSKISMKSFYSSLLLFILLLSNCNCWDIAEGELEHDGGHTIWRIKNPRDISIYDAIADTETCDVEDTSGLADVEDIGLDVEDTGLDVEEMMDYKADLGVDVIDIGDSDQFDVEDISIDVEDGGGDVIEDVWDGGGDGGDISDVEDVCIPDCNGKECGSDGCGGVCGVCGMSAYCSNFKCICNTGYANCDNDWGNGCEKQLDPKHIWSKRFGGSSDDYGESISVDSLGNVYGIGYFYGSNIDFGGCPLSSAGRQDIYLIKYAP